EVPNIHIEHMESPSPNTEFGAKGMGEGGAIAPPAAIMSAINNALRSTGAQVSHTPVTPHRLLSAIRAAAQPANQQDKQPVSEVQA
ncbi:MAG TPA: xanthine dehydrogenase family protein molybdopterin-binding subunit, partial [Alcaligenes faecalis]|nr:xanthine dehydrogenase family protein molybdopterin-binding subunit [Alcaligenes faecalis]